MPWAGLTLPLYAAALGHRSLPMAGGAPAALSWCWLDSLGCVGCVCGLLLAKSADDQLATFMAANQARVASGQSRVRLLDTGLWRFSRRASRASPAPLHDARAARSGPRATKELTRAVPRTAPRHADPNYLGETIFWASLGLFGCASGHWWVLCGVAFNTLVLISVTFMTEQRMLARPERREDYMRYMRTTSAWIPLPKFRDRATNSKRE